MAQVVSSVIQRSWIRERQFPSEALDFGDDVKGSLQCHEFESGRLRDDDKASGSGAGWSGKAFRSNGLKGVLHLASAIPANDA